MSLGSHRTDARGIDQSKLPNSNRKLILHAGIRLSPSSGALSTGSPLSGLDQAPVRLCLCGCRSRSSGDSLGTISGRWATERDFSAANQSGISADSTWIPGLAATDPFCELLFSDAPGSQRALHFDGSPATLLEPTLHAELGMDAVYAD